MHLMKHMDSAKEQKEEDPTWMKTHREGKSATETIKESNGRERWDGPH